MGYRQGLTPEFIAAQGGDPAALVSPIAGAWGEVGKAADAASWEFPRKVFDREAGFRPTT